MHLPFYFILRAKILISLINEFKDSFKFQSQNKSKILKTSLFMQMFSQQHGERIYYFDSIVYRWNVQSFLNTDWMLSTRHALLNWCLKKTFIPCVFQMNNNNKIVAFLLLRNIPLRGNSTTLARDERNTIKWEDERSVQNEIESTLWAF